MRSSSGERRLKTRQRRRMKKLGSRNMGIPQPSFERPPLRPRLHPHQHQTDERTSTMRQCYFSSFSLSSISLWCRSPLAKFLSLSTWGRSVRSYRSTIHAFYSLFHLSFSPFYRQIFGVGTGKTRLYKINLEEEHDEFLDWFGPSGE
jgi:hypothetical protein